MVLVTKLLSAFNNPDSVTDHLFKDAPEMNVEGVKKILGCCEIGTSRLQAIYEQYVLKVGPQMAAVHEI